MLNDFLKKSRVDHHCNIQWADMHNSGTFINRKSVSYARFKCKDEYFDKSSNSCKHTLYVSINLDRNPIRLKSFAVHEIGTHLLRYLNEEKQDWGGCADKRRLYRLREKPLRKASAWRFVRDFLAGRLQKDEL